MSKRVVGKCKHIVGFDEGLQGGPFKRLVYHGENATNSLKTYKGDLVFGWCPLCGAKLTP